MVAIAEKINSSTGTPIKQEYNHHQTARIIQWLGGERAGKLNKTDSILFFSIHSLFQSMFQQNSM